MKELNVIFVVVFFVDVDVGDVLRIDNLNVEESFMNVDVDVGDVLKKENLNVEESFMNLDVCCEEDIVVEKVEKELF